MIIKKAILPVAGFGTRFLPASKSIPKEMVTIVDRPVIDYVVQEAINAGIDEIILVTHASKSSIENYFDTNFELEAQLKEKGKFDILVELESIIPSDIKVVSVRQGKPLGLGHAVLCAKDLVGDEPFAVLLPDVLVYNESEQAANDLKIMIDHFECSQIAQIMVEEIPDLLVDQYGIVDVVSIPKAGESILMNGIVEKPVIGSAPSNLSVVGRYVLPAEIMPILEQTSKGAGGEIQLTDAIAKLQEQVSVEAYRMKGITFDCGSKIGYLKAILHYASLHPTLGAKFKELMRTACTE